MPTSPILYVWGLTSVKNKNPYTHFPANSTLYATAPLFKNTEGHPSLLTTLAIFLPVIGTVPLSPHHPSYTFTISTRDVLTLPVANLTYCEANSSNEVVLSSIGVVP